MCKASLVTVHRFQCLKSCSICYFFGASIVNFISLLMLPFFMLLFFLCIILSYNSSWLHCLSSPPPLPSLLPASFLPQIHSFSLPLQERVDLPVTAMGLHITRCSRTRLKPSHQPSKRKSIPRSILILQQNFSFQNHN